MVSSSCCVFSLLRPISYMVSFMNCGVSSHNLSPPAPTYP